MFSVTKAVRCQTDIFDSSIYKIHTDNGNIRLFVANDSFITLLDTFVDIMSDAGRLITNCENCGQLMITNRANASLTCGRTTCKKERLYKANDDYKKRAMKDPIKEAYLNFDNKCRSYRKKLSDYPELLEKYNKAFDKRREKIRAVALRKNLCKNNQPQKNDFVVRAADRSLSFLFQYKMNTAVCQATDAKYPDATERSAVKSGYFAAASVQPQTPEVYPLWEYPVKMKKSSNISVTALHRFIPQPASGRSSALPCLAAFLVWSEFWRLLRLHGLIFRT